MRARRLLFAVAVAAQLLVLYVPSAPGPPAGLRLDLLVHAVAFGAAAWTGRRAGLPVLPLLVALALHAPLSELVQGTLLPDRSADPLDVVADLVGLVVGALLPAGRDARDREGTR